MTEEYTDYLEDLRQTSKYLANPVGLSNYHATSVSDQTSIRQNNTIIQLLVQIHKKVDLICEKLVNKNQKEDPHIEDLINKLENLKLGKEKPIRTQEPYKFGVGR